MVSRTEKLELMTRLARKAQEYIRAGVPIVRFGRLRKSIKFIVSQNRVILFSYYHWARVINDGRGKITKLNGIPMIFYRDPLQDPRIALDYPRRAQKRIKLTAAQLKEDRAAGKLIFAREVEGVDGLRFIENGILLFRKEAPKELRELVRGRTRSLLRRAGSKTRLTVVL